MKYEIGARIKKHRENKHLTQKQLADMIGISSNRISNWEQGLNRPDADIIADICRALDVSPSVLLDVQLSTDQLTEKEQQLIMAYRTKTALQPAIDILLGLDESI